MNGPRRLAPVLLALVVTACATRAGSPSPTAAGKQLTIFGAASLTGVLGRVKSAYAAAHPGTTLVISTDSSAALEAQIEQGAPADVFLSADQANPRMLSQARLTDGPPVSFAGNKLVIVVPSGDPGGVVTPLDLARPGLKIVAAGRAVPITKYAEEAVANLARQPGYPADFVAAYAANIVSREDNVTALLAKVELGEGDAGIVYVTDARTTATVQTIDIPTAANVLATYDGVVIKSSRNAAAAQAFLDWFVGPDGQAILTSFGFLPPAP